MAYMDKFIVAVKHNGKILRETSDVVYLPFGAEYSILLKNKNSMNAVASVEIDGMNVVDGKNIIVPPNESVELKGFMKGMSVNNRFKFIQKTEAIRKYRGDRIDDGMIRVEFRFEAAYQHCKPLIWNSLHHSDPWYFYENTVTTYNTSFSCNSIQCSSSDEGITVKGSKTHQPFVYGYVGPLEEKAAVIIVRLRGYKASGDRVVRPLTTKTKLTCSTCGKISKSYAKFCTRCGTYLE